MSAVEICERPIQTILQMPTSSGTVLTCKALSKTGASCLTRTNKQHGHLKLYAASPLLATLTVSSNDALPTQSSTRPTLKLNMIAFRAVSYRESPSSDHHKPSPSPAPSHARRKSTEEAAKTTNTTQTLPYLDGARPSARSPVRVANRRRICPTTPPPP